MHLYFNLQSPISNLQSRSLPFLPPTESPLYPSSLYIADRKKKETFSVIGPRCTRGDPLLHTCPACLPYAALVPCSPARFRIQPLGFRLLICRSERPVRRMRSGVVSRTLLPLFFFSSNSPVPSAEGFPLRSVYFGD